MPLVQMKCPNCGGILAEDSTKDAVICGNCQTPFIVEKAIQNYITNNNVTNNITTDKVIISPEKDFDIQAEILISYNGESTIVHIPEGVKKVDHKAFCSNRGRYLEITELHFPSTIIEIEHIICYGIAPEKITVSQNSTKYHSSENCIIETETRTLVCGLSNSIIPNDGSVTTIGDHAFYGCRNLKSITIPNSIMAIGEAAFYGCGNLESITMPNSVITIGDHAFSGCNNLKNITMPNGVTTIGVGTFSDCRNLESIIIPDSITTIDMYAFKGCGSLKSIIIPPSVTSIGKLVLEGCDNLAEVAMPAILKNAEPDGCFCELFGLEHNFGDELPKSLKKLVINGGNIGNDEFRGCYTLTSINILEGVTGIGRSAFEDCSGLENVVLPSTITSIGDHAFSGCLRLKSIAITDSVKSIGNSAFRRCESLTNISIPSSVSDIGIGVFYACDARKNFQHKKPKKCFVCGEKMPLLSKKCKCGAEYL